jgi:nucleoid-associated protein YgaU
MPNTDFSSVGKQHIHTKVSLRKPLRCGFAIVLCSCLFYGAAQCRAQETQTQDVAAAARQERARKEQETKAPHVYTDQDLQRDKILTPEDAARLAAQRKLEGSPLRDTDGAAVDASAVPELPLGDVARLYRSAKRATESPFHIPFDEPAFAAPVEPIQPAQPGLELNPAATLSKIGSSRAAAVATTVKPHSAVRVVAPRIQNAPLHRRDPFARQFVPVAPAAPAVSAPAPVASVPNVSANLSKRLAPVTPPVAAVGTPAVSRPNPVKSAPGLRSVTVRNGDTLWKIAQENLGHGGRWRDVLAANPAITSPEALKAGMQINLPADVRTPRAAKVKVKSGDSLTKIAQAQYGKAGYWRCILNGNPSLTDPNRIYEGQELLLPSECKP